MYGIIVTVLAVLFFVAFSILFCGGGYLNKLLVRFGLAKRKERKNWAVMAWESCLCKLKYKSDIVFLGDSITRGSDFGNITDKKVVNLGMTGDTIEGMLKRVPMIKAVEPEKVFILGGINSLCDRNLSMCIDSYEELLKAVKSALPTVEIIIQSVLPISHTKERTRTKSCHNSTIRRFNSELRELACRYDALYVDLYTNFDKDGEMASELTRDGIHLNDKGYEVWTGAIKEYL